MEASGPGNHPPFSLSQVSAQKESYCNSLLPDELSRPIKAILIGHAARLVDWCEIHFLRKIEALLVGRDLAGDQEHRRTVTM
jgi:hypothetical protein